MKKTLGQNILVQALIWYSQDFVQATFHPNDYPGVRENREKLNQHLGTPLNNMRVAKALDALLNTPLHANDEAAAPISFTAANSIVAHRVADYLSSLGFPNYESRLTEWLNAPRSSLSR